VILVTFIRCNSLEKEQIFRPISLPPSEARGEGHLQSDLLL